MVLEGRGLLVGWRPHGPVFGEAAALACPERPGGFLLGVARGQQQEEVPPSFLTERHSHCKQRDGNAAQLKTGKRASVPRPPARTSGPPPGLCLPAVVPVLSLLAFPIRTPTPTSHRHPPTRNLGTLVLVPQISLSTYCVLLLPRALWVPSSVWGEMLPELPRGAC